VVEVKERTSRGFRRWIVAAPLKGSPRAAQRDWSGVSRKRFCRITRSMSFPVNVAPAHLLHRHGDMQALIGQLGSLLGEAQRQHRSMQGGRRIVRGDAVDGVRHRRPDTPSLLANIHTINGIQARPIPFTCSDPPSPPRTPSNQSAAAIGQAAAPHWWRTGDARSSWLSKSRCSWEAARAGIQRGRTSGHQPRGRSVNPLCRLGCRLSTAR